MLGQHVAHALPRAVAPQRDGDALAAGLQRLHVGGQRLEHVLVRLAAFGDEILAGARGDIDDSLLPALPRVRGSVRRGWRGERRHLRQRRPVESCAPFTLREVKSVRRQRLIGRTAAVLIERLLARLIIVGDLRQPFVGGLFGQRLEDDGRAAHIIEQRFQTFVEQRQPVLHAGVAAALGDGGIEHVIGAGGAEGCDIAGAEGADSVAGELEFGHRHEIKRAQIGIGALRLRIEAADQLQRVTEKIEPHRLAHAGREQVEDTAAHGVVARLAHRRGAVKAVEIEPLDDTVHRQKIAGCRGERLPGNDVARRHPLQDGIDRREQYGGPGAGGDAREPRQRRHALRNHGRMRRYAVVRQAIPGGKFEGLGFRRKKCEGARQHRHARPVAADHRRADRRRLVARGDGAGQIGDHQAFGAVRDLCQEQRPAGRQALCGRGCWRCPTHRGGSAGLISAA